MKTNYEYLISNKEALVDILEKQNAIFHAAEICTMTDIESSFGY